MAKSLGQIAYEGANAYAKLSFGAWEKAPKCVRDAHEELAAIVKKEVIKRIRKIK